MNDSPRPIVRRYRQWCLTTYGLEARNGAYVISKHHLHDKDWVELMAGKEWVDMADFTEALTMARAIWPLK